MTDEHDEHVYYWAWLAEDNKGLFNKPKFYRVFRSQSSRAEARDQYVSEPMSKQEAIELCNRIVKLTGGVTIL